jgi:aldehyde dehydrogenase (NAD+)
MRTMYVPDPVFALQLIKPSRPKRRQPPGWVLGDEEDTRRAIAAAKRGLASFGRSTQEERAAILDRLHEAASARLDDLTAAMVKEHGGVVQFARPIVQSGINAFLASEETLQELPLTRSWGNTTVTLEVDPILLSRGGALSGFELRGIHNTIECR